MFVGLAPAENLIHYYHFSSCYYGETYDKTIVALLLLVNWKSRQSLVLPSQWNDETKQQTRGTKLEAGCLHLYVDPELFTTGTTTTTTKGVLERARIWRTARS